MTRLPQGAIQILDLPHFERMAAEAGVAIPTEQSRAWDRFDKAMPDRQPWGRLAYLAQDGQPRALIALSQYAVRGVPYGWAKHGPMWLGDKPAATEEADLRALLKDFLQIHAPHWVFVRLHAWAPAEDLLELLQTMTYDRTIVVNLERESEEDLLASFSKQGRRNVRKTLRNEGVTYHDETEIAERVWPELYHMLLETAERDGFRVASADAYLTMLRALGTEHALLSVARLRGGEALSWSISVKNGPLAARYYAASSSLGHELRAADALVFKEACWLRASGVREHDLMGIDSPRAPELAGVGAFKAKFAPDGAMDVPGAWDMPLHDKSYALLTDAMQAKHGLHHVLAAAKSGRALLHRFGKQLTGRRQDV